MIRSVAKVGNHRESTRRMIALQGPEAWGLWCRLHSFAAQKRDGPSSCGIGRRAGADEPAGGGSGENGLLPRRTREEADAGAGFCRELEAAGGGEIKAGSVDDDGDRGAAAEREIRGPESLCRRRGRNKERRGEQIVRMRGASSAEGGGVGPDGKARSDRSCDPDDASLGVVGLGEGAAGEMDEKGERWRPCFLFDGFGGGGGDGFGWQDAEPFVDFASGETALRQVAIEAEIGGKDGGLVVLRGAWRMAKLAQLRKA